FSGCSSTRAHTSITALINSASHAERVLRPPVSPNEHSLRLRLEDQLQSELDQPRRICLAADDPKSARVVDICRRPAEHYTVEDIVELRAELHVYTLGDVSVLEHRDVFVVVEQVSHVRQTG